MTGVSERLSHALTFYHWRYNRRAEHGGLAMCSCGWKCRMFRRVARRTQLRSVLLLCWLRGHRWGENNETHTGPVGFKESEDTLIGTTRQCERCWKVINV